MMKILLNGIALLVVADLVLAVTGYGVNYEHAVVQPGQTYYAEQYGDLGLQKSPSLACRYWKGLKSSLAVYEYGTEGEAKETCPRVLKSC